MRNKIEDLRNHLFIQLEELSDECSEKELAHKIKRARAIGNIAQIIINTAKIEIDFCNKSKIKGTGFFQIETDRMRLNDSIKDED